MRLYIVRHAIAIPKETPGIRDEDRTLSEEGVKKMQRAAVGLRGLEFIPELLLSSPLVRAIQTAEILAEAFGKKTETKIIPSLAPSGSRQDLYGEIARYGKRLGSLMLVGHQPSLGEIAGEIAWGSADFCIDLKKGGACALEVEKIQGVLRGSLIALLSPSVLRKISTE